MRTGQRSDEPGIDLYMEGETWAAHLQELPANDTWTALASAAAAAAAGFEGVAEAVHVAGEPAELSLQAVDGNDLGVVAAVELLRSAGQSILQRAGALITWAA
jgi:hypothetical protein